MPLMMVDIFKAEGWFQCASQGYIDFKLQHGVEERSSEVGRAGKSQIPQQLPC